MAFFSRLRGQARSGAIFVALGILLSRISGLVRERVFAHYLGNSLAAGAFKAALRIPNFLQNLFGEGVLSASFIPVYARLLAENRAALAGEMAGVIASLLGILVSILVLAGVLLTPFLVSLVAPGFQGDAYLLTVKIVRVLFPGIGLLVLSAWCLGILNSHRKFFLSYAAPVLWNGAMIGALIFYGSASTQEDLVIHLAWGSFLGCFLQLLIQLPFVFRYAPRIRPGLNLALREARVVLRNFGPVFVSRGVVQLSAYIDGMIASFLGAGAVAGLAYAQTIYLLPVSLFGMSIAAAELPEMAGESAAGEESYEKLRKRLLNARMRIAFFVIPSVVAILFLGQFLVSALYETGAFGAEDTRFVWYILIGSAVGLMAATWGRLYSSAFYALGDTRTPLAFACIRVILTAGLGILFAFPLRNALTSTLVSLGFRLPLVPQADLALGAVGLTASAGLAGWIEFLMLKKALEKKIGGCALPFAHLFRKWILALSSAAFAFILDLYLGNELRSWIPAFFPKSAYSLLIIIFFGVMYLAFSFLGEKSGRQKEK